MCLDSVAEIYEEPADKELRVYKVFEWWTGEPHFMYYGGVASTERWLKSSSKEIKADSLDNYPSGFHCFKTKRGAQQYAGKGFDIVDRIIVRVKIRRVVCVGLQRGYTTYVARQMFVPKEEIAKGLAEAEATRRAK